MAPPPTPTPTAEKLRLPAAAKYVHKNYEQLRDLVRAGVFTKVVFSTAPTKPHISLYVDELDAFLSAGIDGVRRLRSEKGRTTTTAGA